MKFMKDGYAKKDISFAGNHYSFVFLEVKSGWFATLQSVTARGIFGSV